MLLSKLLKGIEYEKNDLAPLDVETVTSDVDLIREKTLFIFLKGTKFDKKNTAAAINSKRPLLIISDTELSGINIPILYVKNARMAYAYALWNLCEINSEKIKFYAVTGTNGKTTTATMLYKIFTSTGAKCGFIGTGKIIIEDKIISDEFYSMTTPDPEILYPTIKRMQNDGCEKIVMEISSHSLALNKIAPIRFETSIFTNLTEEHLDFHKTMENYYKAKLSLFFQSKNAVFNLDDKYARKARTFIDNYIETYGIGLDFDADAMAKDVKYEGFDGISYLYREKDKIFKVELQTSGKHNVLNSMLAIKCALIANVSPRVIRESFRNQKGIEGRFEIISRKPIVIIDYAHTPEALERILKSIRELKTDTQNIITVFGCGGERDTQKRPKMAEISEAFSDITIITSDNSRNESLSKIISEIIVGFTNDAKYRVLPKREEAILHAIEKAGDTDIVLLIGKGHERYTIDANGYHHFDERKIIHTAIKEKN